MIWWYSVSTLTPLCMGPLSWFPNPLTQLWFHIYSSTVKFWNKVLKLYAPTNMNLTFKIWTFSVFITKVKELCLQRLIRVVLGQCWLWIRACRLDPKQWLFEAAIHLTVTPSPVSFKQPCQGNTRTWFGLPQVIFYTCQTDTFVR